MNNYNKNNYNRNNNQNKKKNVVELTGDNFINIAEKVIIELKDEPGEGGVLTTSQIRNILSLNIYIYNYVMEEQKEDLNQEIRQKINYMKVRCVYEAGRSKEVKKFIESSNLLEYIDKINGKRSNFLIFSRYLEALVAYRKFLVGGDE